MTQPSVSLSAWVWLVACAAGCSLLVDPNDEPVRCAPSVPGSCPAGQTCTPEGTCSTGTTRLDGGSRPDAPVPDGCDVERCNQIDDDCDGRIDEGHDQDGDGYTWCGDGIDMASRDCDDSVASTRPGAPEVCDLVDNDCDGATDESPTTICSGGQVCSSGSCLAAGDCRLATPPCSGDDICDTSTSPAHCITPGCTPADCTSPEVCDPVTGDCITPLVFGSACTRDAECATDLCAPATLIGLSTVPSRMCTQSCCSDRDCPSNAVCFASGLGPKLCIPLEYTGLTSVGAGGAGASCSSGTTCRSGRCFTGDNACLAQCAHAADCDGLACVAYPIGSATSAIVTTFCDTAGGGGFGDFCLSDNDCGTGLCRTVICTQPCRSSADCGSGGFCTYLSRRGDWVAACDFRTRAGGTATTGAACASPDDCEDRVCYEGRCADICCTNADCPEAGYDCKPISVGDHYEMHCVP